MARNKKTGFIFLKAKVFLRQYVRITFNRLGFFNNES